MFLNSRAERLTRPLRVAKNKSPLGRLLRTEVFQGEHADNGFVLFEFQELLTDLPAEVREASGTS